MTHQRSPLPNWIDRETTSNKWSYLSKRKKIEELDKLVRVLKQQQTTQPNRRKFWAAVADIQCYQKRHFCEWSKTLTLLLKTLSPIPSSLSTEPVVESDSISSETCDATVHFNIIWSLAKLTKIQEPSQPHHYASDIRVREKSQVVCRWSDKSQSVYQWY